MHRARLMATMAGVLTTAALLAGCGDPEFEYPHDSAEGVYFKVPSDWTVFDQTAEYLEGRVAGQATSTPIRIWTIDSSDPPNVENAAVFDGDHPVGTAQIIEVVPSLSEAISIADIRSIGFEFDPVSPATGLEETWEVSLDQPLRTKDGISGAVAMFNHRETPDDPWLSQAREVFLDASRQRVYILDLYCSASCFEAHRDDIFDVLDSWRIDL